MCVYVCVHMCVRVSIVNALVQVRSNKPVESCVLDPCSCSPLVLGDPIHDGIIITSE